MNPMRIGLRLLLVVCSLFFLGTGFFACGPDEDCAQCKEGETRCSPDQRSLYRCKKLESTGCWQMVSTRCLPGEVCEMQNGKASCRSEAVTCMSACQPGARKCEGGQPWLCAKEPADVCPQWKAQGTCSDGRTCDPSTGACGQANCKPKKPESEKRCDGKAVHWFDDCGNKGAQVGVCKDNEECKAGSCVPVGCNPSQTQYQKRCDNNAVYWFDNCGQKGALVQNCTAQQECRAGVCLTKNCNPTEPQKEKRCVGNTVYWFDNCGKQSTKDKDCSSSEECKNGNCVPRGCTPSNPKKEKRCVGTEVYWFDDCGQKGSLVMQCTSNQQCSAGNCVPKGCTPTNSQKEKRCVGNDVYWFDDCGKQRALVESCQTPNVCQGARCTCTVTNQQATRKCIGNTAYWYDNCGNRRQLIQTCSTTEKCEQGSCKPNNQCPVSHACSIGQRRCQGSAVQSCVTNPQTTCRTWGTAQNCPSGQICQSGNCIIEPRKCSLSIGLGTCKSNSECCQGQTCKSFLIGKFCSSCNSNSDCPKMSGFIQTNCCKTALGNYCALSCPTP